MASETPESLFQHLRYRIDAHGTRIKALEAETHDIAAMSRELHSLDTRIERVEALKPELMQYQLMELSARVKTLTRAAVGLTVTIIGSTVALILSHAV